jgi:hypothetical protein
MNNCAMHLRRGYPDGNGRTVLHIRWIHFFFLDSDIRVGQFTSVPPPNPATWTAYGFTSDDRLIAERQHTESANPTQQYYHGFYVELADWIVGYRFHFSKSRAVINCSQLIIDNSNPSYFQRWGVRGWVSYSYGCSDSRIDSFVGAAKEPDEPETRFSGQVLYKENGAVELWAKDPGERKPGLAFRGEPPIDNPFLRRGKFRGTSK